MSFSACIALPAIAMYQGPFWRLCADVGRRSAPACERRRPVTPFYSSYAMLPGDGEIRAEVTVLLAVRADLAASATLHGGAA